MLLGIVATALLLMWVLTTWTLLRTFDDVGRAVVLDDLGEYSVLYERSGTQGLKDLFAAGAHEHDQFMRVVSVKGVVELERRPDEYQTWVWPDAMASPAPKHGETLWQKVPLEQGGTLTIGRRTMLDGAQFWFGRTNDQDLDAIERVHHLLLLAMLVTSVLTALPILWFASRVLKPVRALMETARSLADDDTMAQRLPLSASIPELREFAQAFNISLDRVQAVTEELEAANDQLAHELRTPLARIRGNVDVVLAHCDEPTSKEAASRAVDEIDRATGLIQTILSIRAGDARSMRLQLEVGSLQELLTETCELYAAAAEESHLAFELLVTGKEEPLLMDRQRVQQAVCNLLDNAFAYTPSGGSVEVELEYEHGNALIQVRDTGPGLSDADHARIWRRFMRGSAASASTPGIGLGLSLVRAIANVHRGEAGAENRPGGGSVFWIRLPLTRAA
jgi:signal transduction histidine kinase